MKWMKNGMIRIEWDRGWSDQEVRSVSRTWEGVPEACPGYKLAVYWGKVPSSWLRMMFWDLMCQDLSRRLWWYCWCESTTFALPQSMARPLSGTSFARADWAWCCTTHSCTANASHLSQRSALTKTMKNQTKAQYNPGYNHITMQMH